MKRLLVLGLALLFSVGVYGAAPPDTNANTRAKIVELIKKIKKKQPPKDKGGAGAVPIDGGLGLLMASGLAFGIHKFRKSKS